MQPVFSDERATDGLTGGWTDGWMGIVRKRHDKSIKKKKVISDKEKHKW